MILLRHYLFTEYIYIYIYIYICVCVWGCVAYPDMNTWNRHIHTGTQNVHNVHNAHIDNIGIPKYKKTLRVLSSGTKRFITFELKGLLTWGRERHNLSMRTFPSAPATRDIRRKVSASSESQPSSSEAKTRLPDFSQIPKIFRARFQYLTSFTSHGHIFYLGFLFWHLWMTHSPYARMNTCCHVAPN